MSKLIFEPGFLPEIFTVPGSKSHANRLLILSAVDPRIITLEHVPASTDVLNLIKALERIGIKIIKNESHLQIQGSFPESEKNLADEDILISTGEGGTTARFLACLLLQGRKTYKLKLGKRLAQRPWQEFIKLAQQLGAFAELEGEHLTIKGPIKNLESQISVDCSQTTQFASGFQLSFSHLPTKIVPLKLKSSRPYWGLTEDLIKNFKTQSSFLIPRDWSSASYPLAFGALRQTIFIPNLAFDPLQADSKFYSLLNDLGGIKDTKGGILVCPIKENKNIEMNVSDCLDLVPALIFLLVHIQGKHKLSGIKNLVHKESDRLNEMCKLLDKFQKNYQLTEDQIILIGSEDVIQAPVELELADDHRIVMTGALFLRFHAGGSLGPIEAVAKSFPTFFHQLAFKDFKGLT